MTQAISRPPGSLSESYRAVNVAVLGLTLYGLALPFVLPVLRRFLPGIMPTCAFLTILGRPCPLCGLTRGIAAVMRGEVTQAIGCNILAVPVFALLLSETAYRAYAVFAGFPAERMAHIIKTDLRLHLSLAFLTVAYALAFMLA